MLDLSILISALALVLSVFAVVLTSMKEGVEMALGFRESEATSAKLKRIRDEMVDEIEKETLTFLKENGKKEKMDPEITKGILDISANMLYGVLGEKLLEVMTNRAKQFLKRLIATTLTVLLTVVYFVAYSLLGLISETTLSFGVIYIFFAIVLGYATIDNARKYFDVRLAFQKLAENPSCEKCEEIVNELKGKGMHEFERFIGIIE
jgi:hypothetical protein